jgi:hypothetical protein
MTFLEAALAVLQREGKPLHYKDLTERAMGKKLLTFVGRTPEVTMQTQLTAAVKKAPGSPFVRVKPGVFGLLRYPEMPPEPEEETTAKPAARGGAAAGAAEGEARGERGRRRRRRGGRGRSRGDEATPGFASNGAEGPHDEAEPEAAAEAHEGHADTDVEEHEPAGAKLSPEARAAALAETGVLEGDDSNDEEGGEADVDADLEEPALGESAEAEGGALAEELDEDEEGAGARGQEEEEDEEEGEGDAEPAAAESGFAPSPRAGGEEAGASGRRRRRRRRRRHGEEGGAGLGGERPSDRPGALTGAGGAGGLAAEAELGRSLAPGAGEEVGAEPSTALGAERPGGAPGEEGRDRFAGEATPAETAEAGAQAGRRIMTPIDAAIEILRGQAPGRGVHVRQIADAAARRRLIHGEPNEAWRVMRTALAAEPRERLRSGQRPRVRAAGSGLFALSRRPPDGELERAEQIFGEARRALRERTVAALERRIADLPGPAFEALARVLLQREGFGPATFVKRVEGTIYVEALRGRGNRPSRCLVGLRPGATSAGRRAIGELRAGIRARNQDEGVLLLAGRLADDAIAEWKQAGPPVEIADGQAVAETCIRHGIGVINTMVSVDFVDADFFAELAEG